MKLPLSITISRPQGNGPEVIAVSIRDDVSFCEILEAEFSLDNFMRALTGQGSIKGDGEWRIVNLGKKRETKTVQVLVPDGPWETRNERARVAIAEHEVDGWRGNVSDATNHHRQGKKADGGYYYNVDFVRFVEAEVK